MSAAGEHRRAGLTDAALYLIVTAGESDAWDLHAVEAALGSGCVDLVQLRDTTADEARMRDRARELMALCTTHGALCLLNDRPDIAAALDMDGAHVGQDDVPVATARAWLGPDRLLGLSTHDAAELGAARALPVDYAGLGPCFPTSSKDLARTPGGPELVARALPAAGTLAVFPIGGITPERAASLAAAGARRAAVGAGILAAADPAAAARALRACLRTE